MNFLVINLLADQSTHCRPTSPLMAWDWHLFNLARSFDMKKTPPNSPQPGDDNTDSPKLSDLTEHRVSARLRKPGQPDPVSYFFTLQPDIDTLSLLAHACETLASLNVMSTDLARNLESSHRNIALAIQQLAVLAELLINRALDNLDPPGGMPEAPTNNAY
jgi:hypothetical protein